MNNDDHNKNPDQDIKQQVLVLLNQLGDRMKRAEAEREGLREQIREYREHIQEIEDRAETTEKVYLNIENRLNAYDRSETELREELHQKVQKLEALEAQIPDLTQIETALQDKIPDTAALEKQLADQIPDVSGLEQRVQAAEREAQQAREAAEIHADTAGKLERRVEQLINDNTRITRKLERLEDNVAKTDDAMKSRAMVLLTDREAARQSGQGYLPAGGAYAGNTNDDIAGQIPAKMMRMPRLLQHPVMRVAGMIALIFAGMSAGWLVNEAARTGPGVPAKITQNMQETGQNTRQTTMAQMNMTPRTSRTIAGTGRSSESPVTLPAADSTAGSNGPEKPESPTGQQKSANTGQQTQKQTQKQNGKPRQTDDQAARMNAITPAAGETDRETEQIQERKLPEQLATIYKQARGAEEAAEEALMSEKPEQSLSERIEPNAELPGRYDKLQSQAFNGDARAQHDLAALYAAGRNGVEQDYGRALKLFRAAAWQDIANARYNLGVLYHQGLGVDRDMAKAIRYYRAASLLDHAQARYNLGIAHIKGVGTKYNPRYAAAYFEKATRSGVVEAAYNLGLIYENGLAGKADTDLALFWYHHAAENGSQQAQKAMDQIAGRLDLSEADIEDIVKDTDLDVTMPANQSGNQDANQKQGADKRDSEEEALNLPGTVKPAFAPSNDPDLVVQIQRQLSRLDLYSGNTDGDIGPKTRKAIKTYQDMHDLPKTGKSSEDLLVHMLSRSIEESGKTQAAN